ncbi:PEP-CTERM sorting domain-containing protein [Methylobacillus glycogenes]
MYVTAVPEPEQITLMLLGLALLTGACLRRLSSKDGPVQTYAKLG